MELNRNQYMLMGVLALLLGLQFRFVDAFVLNETCTRFLVRQSARSEPASIWSLPVSFAAQSPVTVQRKRVSPPRWLAWGLIAAGAVLVLHSMALKKPGQ